jgi:hypothetical protein
MVVLNLAFDEGLIPMGYKMRVNEYLVTIRSTAGEGEAPAAKAAAGAAPAVPEPAAGDDFSVDEEAPAAEKNAGKAAAAPATKGAEAPVKPAAPAAKSGAGNAAGNAAGNKS